MVGLDCDAQYHPRVEQWTNQNDTIEQQVLELLARAHLPDSFCQNVVKLFRGFPRSMYNEPLLTVCLGETLISNGIPLTLNELSGISGIENKKLIQTQKKYFPSSENVILPSQLVNRIASKLGMPSRLSIQVERCLQNVEKHRCFTKSPASIVGAALYNYHLTHGMEFDLKSIARACNVSVISLKRARDRYKGDWEDCT